MSRQQGAVLFSDGTIKYIEYSNTVECVASKLFDTIEEVDENWRKGEPIDCTCGSSEPVQLFDGSESYYKAVACRKCQSVEFQLSEDNWPDCEIKGEKWGENLGLWTQ